MSKISSKVYALNKKTLYKWKKICYNGYIEKKKGRSAMKKYTESNRRIPSKERRDCIIIIGIADIDTI